MTVRAINESSVVITGGTSGIGLATAHAFAAAGAPHVVLVGRNPERGAGALETVKTAHRSANVVFVAGDGDDPAQATSAAEEARTVSGRIDVFINATAGPYLPRLILDTPVADVGDVLVQQAFAPLLMTRIVLPWMCEQEGGRVQRRPR